MAEVTVEGYVRQLFLTEHASHTQTTTAANDGTVHLKCSCGATFVLSRDGYLGARARAVAPAGFPHAGSKETLRSKAGSSFWRTCGFSLGFGCAESEWVYALGP